ncbi:MAG: phosphate acetyltransferase [Tissierellia bacterium]|nr:phosphate acetyltransferase [Tissierellia bacterium]
MGLIEDLKEQVQVQRPTIVFPEGEDERILGAAVRLRNERIIQPIVLGKLDEIKRTATRKNLDIRDLIIIEPENYDDIDTLVEAFVERRKGKVNQEEALEILKDPNYFGTLLVYTNRAAGMVSGAIHTTGATVKPALQIIKTKPGFKRTSGLFILVRGGERYLMADCAINIDLDAEGLAEVAILSDMTGKQFGFEPKIAMLSFSTKGSAASDEVDKVAEATRIALEREPGLALDGELQFDAAFVPTVASKKAPDSKVAGYANTFIFPNLASGNIGYKIAQRLGGFEAIGPVLQGLNMPVNDLSRGCNEDEVYALSVITAAQAVL